MFVLISTPDLNKSFIFVFIIVMIVYFNSKVKMGLYLYYKHFTLFSPLKPLDSLLKSHFCLNCRFNPHKDLKILLKNLPMLNKLVSNNRDNTNRWVIVNKHQIKPID